MKTFLRPVALGAAGKDTVSIIDIRDSAKLRSLANLMGGEAASA